ncbi:hypothetical protein LguiA_019844 [Lonicera macranthoides]
MFFSLCNKYFMAATLLVVRLVVPIITKTGAQSIGACYGRNGNDLPNEQNVVNLYNTNGIKRMRVYDPILATLQALKGTNIEVMLDVPNPDLQALASNPSAATQWVQKYIQDFTPGVKFRYISVGNEVDPNTGAAQYFPFVLPAMINIHSAIVSRNLEDQVRVSTASYSGLLGNSYPPSQGSYRENVKPFINPIINFLVENNLPLLVNVYPYFSYIGDPKSISLEYTMFTSSEVVVMDPEGNRGYKNLFDALLDAHYAAVDKAGGPNVEIVVSESGWPSDGGTAASVENAAAYYRNLIGHVKGGSGTPRRPGKAIEAYLFAMFDENLKMGAESEKHFGLFSPNQQPKYQLSFK